MTHIEDKKCCENCPHLCNCGAKKPDYAHKHECSFLKPHTPQKDIERNWRGEFSQRFGKENYPYIDGNALAGELKPLWDDVKDFIESLLKQERERVERVIDGMMKERNFNRDGAGVLVVDVYNSALTDIKAKLKNEI